MYFNYQSVPPSNGLATQSNLRWVLESTGGSVLGPPSHDHDYAVNHLCRWPAGTWFCLWSSAVWRRCRTGLLSSLCSTCGAPLRSSGELPPSLCLQFFLSVVMTVPLPPPQVPLLHAGLHRHRVEAANVDPIQHLDPSVPAGGFGWR